MQFRLLGTLEVEGDTGLVPLRGARRRVLVARLALSPNQAVPTERLIDDLWSGSPSSGAASTLSSHVSLVRQLLGADRIEHVAGGYRLVVRPGELDTSEFEEQLEVGRQAVRARKLESAVLRVGAALALWRGRALADVADAPWAQGEIARLEELRLGAEELVLEARLGLGQHRELVAAAEAAVAAAPFREQRWATLLLALYRSDRQADALRAFQRLRRQLNDELGIEPSSALADLEQAVVLQSPELRWVPQVLAPPQADPRSHGRGSREPGIDLVEELCGSLTTFVGRTRELDRLRKAYGGAGEGRRSLVLIGGEPGIGKSSLAAALAKHVQEDGGAILLGRCTEGAGVPYQPFVEAVDRFVEEAPQAFLDAHAADYGGDLARLSPAFERQLPQARPRSSSDPDTERYLTFAAVSGLLEAAAEQKPLLVVLEDLHWAESSTVELFRHLIAHVWQTELTLVATFRTSEITDESKLGTLLTECSRDPQITRVDLDGLTQSDVQTLSATMAPDRVDRGTLPAFARELTEETDGNPLFVCELLRHLAESHAADGKLTPWSTPGGVPASLQGVIGQRVRTLGTRAARILAVASVIGVEFDIATLAEVAEIDVATADGLIDYAVRASLVRVTGGDSMRFSHALVQRTLYQELLPVRRRQLHGKAAAAIEVSVPPPSPSSMAIHYLGAGEDEAALRWAERAGYDAAARVAPDEAARWFTTACELVGRFRPEEELRRCDLLTQLGMALLQAGQPSFREVLLEACVLAERAGDGRRLAAAALANTRGFYSAAGITDGERLDALQRALGAVGQSDGTLRARLIAAICSEAVFDVPLAERRSLAEEAKAQARAVGDPRTTVDVHNMVVEPLRFPTELAQRLEDTAVALRCAEVDEDPAALFWAIGHRMRTLVEAGQVVEAHHQFDRMVAISDRLGQPVLRWMSLFSSAQWSFLRGDVAHGEELAEQAFALGERIGQPDAFNYYATQLSHARWQQGRLDEIVDLIEQGGRDNPGIPSYQAALARARAQAGDRPGARELLEDALSRRFADIPEDLLWTYGMVAFAEVAIRLEHAEAAEAIFDLLVPFESQVSFLGTTCEGPIAHYLGGTATVLGRFDEARRMFDLSLGFAEAADSPYFHVRTTIEAGWLTLRTGDASMARHLLTSGRSMAQRGSYLGEVRRAEEVLARMPA
jgi:DNA-binding SARP family transcriptional activator/tetratricopeptide (TPR) repeat protein